MVKLFHDVNFLIISEHVLSSSTEVMKQPLGLLRNNNHTLNFQQLAFLSSVFHFNNNKYYYIVYAFFTLKGNATKL